MILKLCEENMSQEAEKVIDVDISEEKIEKAALPENKRVEEEISDSSVEVGIDENVKPVTEDEGQEDVDVSKKVEHESKDLSEVERRAAYAQNRINKAVAQAKEYQRRELMALQYAKELKQQNEQLTNHQQSFANNYSEEASARIDSQITLAKQALKQATEAGDSDAVAKATEALTLASADKSRIDQYKQSLAQYQQYYEANPDQNLQNYQPQQVQEFNEPSVKAQDWAAKNDSWFNKDPVATNVAYTIHADLVQKGFDTESDEYYHEIDRRLREELPNKFNNVEANKPVQTVASPSRNTSTGRKKNRIELTPSEQQLAKKLGVSFKDYAIQKARLQKS